MPIPGCFVIATSSTVPAYTEETTTDASGAFLLDGTPIGGMILIDVYDDTGHFAGAGVNVTSTGHGPFRLSPGLNPCGVARALGVQATARNWRSVTKILGIAEHTQ